QAGTGCAVISHTREHNQATVSPVDSGHVSDHLINGRSVKAAPGFLTDQQGSVLQDVHLPLGADKRDAVRLQDTALAGADSGIMSGPAHHAYQGRRIVRINVLHIHEGNAQFSWQMTDEFLNSCRTTSGRSQYPEPGSPLCLLQTDVATQALQALGHPAQPGPVFLTTLQVFTAVTEDDRDGHIGQQVFNKLLMILRRAILPG